ncbi:type IV pilus biogenesis/stability protein PilW [Pseudidiomarina indica]|uniref:Type IV pilus biogenesis/stability protein PilW n=1 Tax=Pseudidiomarina indica TaxID=1159017 RepID=A0A1G6BFI6_9GAMM|nr:tetratricopeptide repeat protein [Pseudidiomarina indica]SDB19402.1 type IV pilus biogenesis/stability protein PilW [Pseudidiomarina indica]
MRIMLLMVLAGMLTTGCAQPRSHNDAAANTRLALGLQYLQGGNLEQAKANLVRALQHSPQSANVQAGLAHYYQHVHDWPKAEQHYQRAIELAPENGDNYNNLGVLLCRQQRYAAAQRMFQRALTQPSYAKLATTYQNAAHCAQQQGDSAQARALLKLARIHSTGERQ